MAASSAWSRRDVLIGLAGVAPAALALGPVSAGAQAGGEDFLWASRVIAGTDALSAGAGARIEALLAERVDGFEGKLADLVAAMRAADGGREAMLGALSEDQTSFALQVARPWYLGYVGEPSSTILQDDAAFATFLEAQGFSKILGEVPRPTYPGHAAGWWATPPPGVTPPAMPAEILSWTFHPGEPDRILPPDPAWRAYAVADHEGVDAARRAKPGTAGEAD